MSGDWSGPLSAADLDEIEAETRREQEQALAALPAQLEGTFDSQLGSGWCAAHPEIFADMVQKAMDAFRKILEQHWRSFHAARAARFPDEWPPPLH